MGFLDNVKDDGWDNDGYGEFDDHDDNEEE